MKYNYCPNCGQKGSVKWKDPSTAHCQKCNHDFWNNPSATVAVVFLKGDQALFAKRGIEPNKGKYDFPGGFVNYKEDIYDACVREVQEETSLTIDKANLQLVTGYSLEYLPRISVVDLIFVITKWQGEFKAQDDVAELEWKPLQFVSDARFVPPYDDLPAKIAAITSE